MQKLDYNRYDFTGNPIRITWHWTGGSYTPSSLDAEHYQFLIGYENGEATTYLGKYSVADQDSTAQHYAAHTRGFNTKNIGIALCGMAGAREKGAFGQYPLKEAQIEEMIRLTAYLCGGYGIAPEPEYLASHCEIEAIHGKPQSGKWDISALDYSNLSWVPLNNRFRERVMSLMHGTPPWHSLPGDGIEAGDDLKDTLDALIVAAQALEAYALVARKNLKQER